MKNHLFRPAVVLLALASFSFRAIGAEEKSELPGTQEQASVDQANKELDAVYAKLVAKVDTETKTSLRDAQRAWIKWRDAEAMFIARHGGSIGGSALRTDYAEAQAKLIDDRTVVLKSYLSQAPKQ
jgi:uncharacterized protein YecT (DUF1311 family)